MIPTAPVQPVPIGLSWSEVQTPEGRVYYFNTSTGVSQWEKPDELRTSAEKSVKGTDWLEYKIWDGRSYYVNPKTKCSVWSVPPEVLQAQKGSSHAADAMNEDTEVILSSDQRYKSQSDRRTEFSSLLLEKGINGSATFQEAMDAIKDDMRFHALPSNEARQMFYAHLITSRSRKEAQRVRDHKKDMYIKAIKDLQRWKSMNDSVTFSQMASEFSNKGWFKELGSLEAMKVFDLFSREYIEIEKLKRQKLQDSFMQQLKTHLLENPEVDFGAEDVVQEIKRAYTGCTRDFWVGLSDAQKLIVYKSCLMQRVREVKTEIMSESQSHH